MLPPEAASYQVIVEPVTDNPVKEIDPQND